MKYFFLALTSAAASAFSFILFMGVQGFRMFEQAEPNPYHE